MYTSVLQTLPTLKSLCSGFATQKHRNVFFAIYMNNFLLKFALHQIPGKCCLPWTSHGAFLWISFFFFLTYFPSKIPEAKNLKQKSLSETFCLLGGEEKSHSTNGSSSLLFNMLSVLSFLNWLYTCGQRGHQTAVFCDFLFGSF